MLGSLANCVSGSSTCTFFKGCISYITCVFKISKFSITCVNACTVEAYTHLVKHPLWIKMVNCSLLNLYQRGLDATWSLSLMLHDHWHCRNMIIDVVTTWSSQHDHRNMIIDIVVHVFSDIYMTEDCQSHSDAHVTLNKVFCALHDDLKLHLCYWSTGIVGEVEDAEDGEKDYYLWTHKKLDIGYNDDKVSLCEVHVYWCCVLVYSCCFWTLLLYCYSSF